MSHTPVLLHEVLEYLDPRPGDFIIDGTVNGGGHASAILETIGHKGTLLGIDWDKKVLAQSSVQKIKNATLLCGNYADLAHILKFHKLPKADGLFLDLGFSSLQMDESARGFSFSKDEPLTMTYAEDEEPVSRILRRVNEEELTRIIREYGEERYARRIAHAIKERLRKSAIETSGELARVVASSVGGGYERGRIHPATRTFQALRIYANHELENLTRVLNELSEIVKPGGRVAIISFHSLEDRIVKNAFRDIAKAGKGELLTKKPITATREEQKENPRSRSAKLRAAILI